jgi:hypothetical protein
LLADAHTRARARTHAHVYKNVQGYTYGELRQAFQSVTGDFDYLVRSAYFDETVHAVVQSVVRLLVSIFNVLQEAFGKTFRRRYSCSDYRDTAL